MLTEKYSWSIKDAAEFADFLLPMLNYNIYERATAFDCLNHPWITGSYPTDYTLRPLNNFSNNPSLVNPNNGNLISATLSPFPINFFHQATAASIPPIAPIAPLNLHYPNAPFPPPLIPLPVNGFPNHANLMQNVLASTTQFHAAYTAAGQQIPGMIYFL